MEIKKLVLTSMLIVLFFSLVVTANVQPSMETSSTIVVPDDYSTIQAAINAANPGDTIAVRSGTYSECMVVNKGVSLIGEDKETTVIRGEGLPKGRGLITVEASNVTVSGFKILNSVYYGIWVKTSDNVIKDNIIDGGDWTGIVLDGRTDQANRNTVINNYVARKYDCGILLEGGSSFNLIKSNVVTGNYFGIYLVDPTTGNNIVAENQVANNSDIGIGLFFGSSSNIIIGNNASDNGWRGNIISAGFAIAAESKSNQILANWITDNRIGIFQTVTSDNKIRHNNLVNNARQVYEPTLGQAPSANIWDDGYPSGGNYWSDYTGVDSSKGVDQNMAGSDGIGDSPYIINSYNRDRYPLMTPYSLQSLLGDLNYDGKADIKDLAIAGVAFGSYPGHPKWNPMADVSQDAKVDIKDLVAIARNFGRKL